MFLKDIIDGDGQRLVTRRSKRKRHWAVRIVLHVSWGETFDLSLSARMQENAARQRALGFAHMQRETNQLIVTRCLLLCLDGMYPISGRA